MGVAQLKGLASWPDAIICASSFGGPFFIGGYDGYYVYYSGTGGDNALYCGYNFTTRGLMHASNSAYCPNSIPIGLGGGIYKKASCP